MHPLVTVYIPTYNRETLVQRAIKSVLKQTYQNIEIIVIDDASSDRTPEILKNLSKEGKIKLLRNDACKGACFSRNRAISVAEGEFITGLDDDDEFIETRIQTFVDSIDRFYPFLFSGYQLRKTSKNQVWFPGSNIIKHSDLLKQNTIGNQIFIKTKLIRECGGFDESLPAWQDYDLWLRLLKQLGPAKRINEASYIVDTSHPHDSISKNINNILSASTLFSRKHPEYQKYKFKPFLALNFYQYPEASFPLSKLIPILFTPAALRGLKIYINKFLTK